MARVAIAMALVATGVAVVQLVAPAGATVVTPTSGPGFCAALDDGTSSAAGRPAGGVEIVLSEAFDYELTAPCVVDWNCSGLPCAGTVTVRAATGENPVLHGSLQFRDVARLAWSGVDLTRSDQPGQPPCAAECPPLMTFTGGNDFQVTQSELFDCNCAALIRVEHDWANGQKIPKNWSIAYNYLHDTKSNTTGGEAIEVDSRAWASMYALIEGNVIVNTPNGSGIRIDGDDSNYGAAVMQVRNNTIVHRRTDIAAHGQGPVVLAGKVTWVRFDHNVLTNDLAGDPCVTKEVAFRGDAYKGEENMTFLDRNLIAGITQCGGGVSTKYNTHYFRNSQNTSGEGINDILAFHAGISREGNRCPYTSASASSEHACVDATGYLVNNAVTGWPALDVADLTLQPDRSCAPYVAVGPAGAKVGAPGFSNCDTLVPVSVVQAAPGIPCDSADPKAGPINETTGMNLLEKFCSRDASPLYLTTQAPPTTTSTPSTTSSSTSTTSTSSSTTSSTSTTTSTTTTVPSAPPVGPWYAVSVPPGGDIQEYLANPGSNRKAYYSLCELLVRVQEGWTYLLEGDHSSAWAVDQPRPVGVPSDIGDPTIVLPPASGLSLIDRQLNDKWVQAPADQKCSVGEAEGSGENQSDYKLPENVILTAAPGHSPLVSGAIRLMSANGWVIDNVDFTAPVIPHDVYITAPPPPGDYQKANVLNYRMNGLLSITGGDDWTLRNSEFFYPTPTEDPYQGSTFVKISFDHRDSGDYKYDGAPENGMCSYAATGSTGQCQMMPRNFTIENNWFHDNPGCVRADFSILPAGQADPARWCMRDTTVSMVDSGHGIYYSGNVDVDQNGVIKGNLFSRIPRGYPIKLGGTGMFQQGTGANGVTIEGNTFIADYQAPGYLAAPGGQALDVDESDDGSSTKKYGYAGTALNITDYSRNVEVTRNVFHRRVSLTSSTRQVAPLQATHVRDTVLHWPNWLVPHNIEVHDNVMNSLGGVADAYHHTLSVNCGSDPCYYTGKWGVAQAADIVGKRLCADWGMVLQYQCTFGTYYSSGVTVGSVGRRLDGTPSPNIDLDPYPSTWAAAIPSQDRCTAYVPAGGARVTVGAVSYGADFSGGAAGKPLCE